MYPWTAIVILAIAALATILIQARMQVAERARVRAEYRAQFKPCGSRRIGEVCPSYHTAACHSQIHA